MRQSRQIASTQKENPKDAHTVSHRLMVRAGYIKQLAAGLYSYLPLLTRTLSKISTIVREEMNAKGSEELLMPALQPKELWDESGRWERYTDIDGVMFAFEDRRGATVCLGPTHEEVITDIVRREVDSYKQLPKILYQIQTKFRDEVRPRFGLMRTREFIMKDAYSFDVDEAALDQSYQAMSEAYHRVCQRIGFEYRCVDADAGAIGGSGGSQEFMVLADAGEDTILYCDSCDYSANQERAEGKIEPFEQDEEPAPMEAVLGEGIIGVEALAEFLKIPVLKTTKTLLFQADDEIVAVMVRGDCDVNEIKVANYLGCQGLALASPEVVKEKTGAEVGYAGPIGLSDDVRVIADHYVGGRVNFECGANQTDYHNINVNFERDVATPAFGDFKLAKAGDGCPCCDSGKLQETRGIEVGHIFKLGSKYSETMDCKYLDPDGRPQKMEMGCYGIGVSRIAAAAIEQNHDDDGIVWPPNIAPFQIHLVGLNLEKEDIRKEADAFYERLQSDGYEVLYDDRELRAGEKFSDADLIGIPVRITVSARTIKEGKFEFKLRSSEERASLNYEEICAEVNGLFG